MLSYWHRLRRPGKYPSCLRPRKICENAFLVYHVFVPAHTYPSSKPRARNQLISLRCLFFGSALELINIAFSLVTTEVIPRAPYRLALCYRHQLEFEDTGYRDHRGRFRAYGDVRVPVIQIPRAFRFRRLTPCEILEGALRFESCFEEQQNYDKTAYVGINFGSTGRSSTAFTSPAIRSLLNAVCPPHYSSRASSGSKRTRDKTCSGAFNGRGFKTWR